MWVDRLSGPPFTPLIWCWGWNIGMIVIGWRRSHSFTKQIGSRIGEPRLRKLYRSPLSVKRKKGQIKEVVHSDSYLLSERGKAHMSETDCISEFDPTKLVLPLFLVLKVYHTLGVKVLARLRLLWQSTVIILFTNIGMVGLLACSVMEGQEHVFSNSWNCMCDAYCQCHNL